MEIEGKFDEILQDIAIYIYDIYEIFDCFWILISSLREMISP